MEGEGNHPFGKPNIQEILNKAKREITRRGFLKSAFAAAVLAAAGEVAYDQVFPDTENKKVGESRIEIKANEFKKLKPDLPFHFKEIHKIPHLENLHIPGQLTNYGADTLEGKIVRTLRYKNIADTVDDKYNLPSNSISAIEMIESTGEILLPNSQGDGGFGLAHMQGAVAQEYGLKTYKGCNEMVCKKHGRELLGEIRSGKYTPGQLSQIDERLHPVFNLDAVGRMLSSYMSQSKLEGKIGDLDHWESAIARFCGARNFKEYWKKLQDNRELLANEEKIEKLKIKFNGLNSHLKINGHKADYDKYMEVMNEQNENYGFVQYKEMNLSYNPAHSKEIVEKYDKAA